jgi:hypothetical protein
MNQRSVLVLSVLTLVSVGAAALALRDPGPSASTSSELLFPEFSERINDLARVRIEKEAKSATLQREGGQWKLADRGGYPAQFEKVKELAVRIAELRIEEAKTNKKANHAKLGLAWPAEAAAEGELDSAQPTYLTFEDSSGTKLAELVLGKTEWQGSKPKVFARRAAEDQVYLCAPRQSLDVEADASRWIDTKLITLANERVQSVAIEHADGERVEIVRSAANHTQFAVENVPLGRSESYAGVANGVAQALASLQLEDVRPAGEVDFTKEPVARTSYRCVDGLTLMLETAKHEGETWVRVAASFVPPPLPETPAEGTEAAPDDTPGEPGADAATAAEERSKEVAKETEELNQRLAPWAFRVPSYKTDQIARRMSDLLAEPTPMGGGDEGAAGLLEGFEDTQDGDAPVDGEEAPMQHAPHPDDEGHPAPAPSETPSDPKPE